MDKRVTNIIGMRIKQAREERDMTQLDLAKMYGCTDVNISAWERGQRNINTSNLQKIANILNKPVAWFFGDTEQTTDMMLPDCINVIRRELDKMSDSYKVVSHSERLVRIKVLDVKVLPHNFDVASPTGHIQIPSSELERLPEESYEHLFAIHITTDLGSEWHIRENEYVIMNHRPEKIDGAFYLVTVQNKMVFRNIEWKPSPVMIDSRGIRTPFNESDMIMSGQVVLIWNTRKPPRL